MIPSYEGLGPQAELFPEQCLHYGVLACLRLVIVTRDSPPPGHSRTRKIIKNLQFLSFFKKMVLAFELWFLVSKFVECFC